MDKSRYSPEAITDRMYRTVLTDYQPHLKAQFQKASELIPELESLDDILNEYEIFLLAGVLVNIREIRELKERTEELKARMSVYSAGCLSMRQTQAGSFIARQAISSTVYFWPVNHLRLSISDPEKNWQIGSEEDFPAHTAQDSRW